MTVSNSPLLIRNVAIIAHVDHGKTTLVDKMLRQAGVFRANQQVAERVMDSNPLERERGITILSKNTAVRWNGVKINIVDTPGHADFGGEVERILRMVQGVLLLVDAAEGPMPQTRFVTRKALELGLQPIVVINKVDRADARPLEVHDEVLGLLMELEATDEQLDAPFLYGSARDGWVDRQPRSGEGTGAGSGASLGPLFQTIVDTVHEPPGEGEQPFQMLVSTIDHSSYVGRIAIGRIERGQVSPGQTVALLPLGDPGMISDGEIMRGRVLRLYGFEGLERVELTGAAAGEIVALAGLTDIEIGTTLTDPEHPERLSGIAVEEPTIAVDFIVNDSPFAGQSGKYVTTRQVRERLHRELERNVALGVEDTEQPDVFRVSGRGELHLAILMETMRREGHEFQVSRPRVITHQRGDGLLAEPYEELLVEVPERMLGVVIEKMGARRGDMIDMRNPGQGRVRMSFKVPSRGLFGFRSEFLTDTQGEGTLHHRFLEYGPWCGPLGGRNRGVLVADREGEAIAYALYGLQDRSTLFVKPGDKVYEGMIVGENSRPGDMDVNVSKEKKLTNIRAAASDENVLLEAPRRITLEYALEYIEEDELIEITPDAIRLRKRALKASARKKAARQVRAARG
ncbi:MAG: translational GTPase TypA [Gemmatimonadota bacterium]|nr:MAG: translational GTPase TypA [Gemmatimonadota bacterium]